MNLHYPTDIEQVLIDLKHPNTSEWKPEKEENQDAYDKILLSKKLERYLARVEKFEENKCKVFAVVIGQSSETLIAKLKGQNDWEEIYREKNLAELMKSIKKWMMNQETSRSPIASSVGAMKALHRMRQNHHESLTEYQKRFTGAAEVVHDMGIGLDVAYHRLVEKSLEKVEKKKKEDATAVGMPMKRRPQERES